MTNQEKRDLIAKRLRYHREMIYLIQKEWQKTSNPILELNLYNTLKLNQNTLDHFKNLAKEAPPKTD